MRGKQTCRILRQIRAEIARRNDLDLVIRECTFQGECRGTCPRCEQEVRYLEEQLEKRRRLQKGVALAGVAAGMIAALSGCEAIQSAIEVQPAASTPPAEEVLLGEIAEITPQPTEVCTMGVAMPEDSVANGVEP